MPTLNKIFDKCGVALYHNESLDLDHYYQEPYQDEQLELETKIKTLKEKLTQTVKSKDNAERWLSLIQKYNELTELTAPLLNELIEKIVVHEASKDEHGKRMQEVDIYYRFVGKIE